MKPVPIHELRRSLATVGRIRTGRKTSSRSGKDRPQGIETFRFTSSDPASLEQVAELYGGTVRPWNDPASPDTHELYTDVNEIRIALPRDPLTQWYELWEGGGCMRRCDGVTCSMLQGGGPDGGEPIEVACPCAGWGQLACEKKTRLSVLLPEVRLLGTWRYDSGSEIVAEQLPAAVDLIQGAAQITGIQRAVMRLVRVHGRGGRRKYTIVQLGLEESLEGLLAGRAQLTALPGAGTPPPAPALGAGTHLDQQGVGDCGQWGSDSLSLDVPVGAEDRDDYPMGGPDDEVIDATLVEPVDGDLVQAWLDSVPTSRRAKLLTRARQLAEEAGRELPLRWEDIPLVIGDALQAEDFKVKTGKEDDTDV